MSCSDIPGMNGLDSVNFVESNLMLDLNEAQATMVFTYVKQLFILLQKFWIKSNDRRKPEEQISAAKFLRTHFGTVEK